MIEHKYILPRNVVFDKQSIPADIAHFFEDARCQRCYICRLVAVFAEVRRVLVDTGTLWLNIGDSYSGGGNYRGVHSEETLSDKQRSNGGARGVSQLLGAKNTPGCKPKDLIGIPWLLAFALRADGWYLRQEIIWCLSGGAWVYAKTQKGVMPIMVRDLARLDPKTVQLWNGEKWTNLLGMSKSPRKGTEIEFVLRSGERISCTDTHKFPTQRGLLAASEIGLGDVLQTCRLPEPETVKDCLINEEAAWFAGLYIAEGSRSAAGDKISIAGHVNEEERWIRVQKIARLYGGTATCTIDGSNMNIRVYGKILCAILDELVTGRTCVDKAFAPVVWRYSNSFLDAMLRGYLSGDAHHDEKNNRYRLGFTRNYNLERDLRTVCARLGYHLTLKLATATHQNGVSKTFRGEIRMSRSGHHNERSMSEIVAIQKARCREVYDLGVEDDPHLFALASGVLTHNSKPNPMPESVTDRCTKAHESLFLLSKSERYFFDHKAIAEPVVRMWDESNGGSWAHASRTDEDALTKGAAAVHRGKGYPLPNADGTRNKRSVWTVPTCPYPDAHFATFPPALIHPCILAGSPEGGSVLDPFAGSGTTLATANRLCRHAIGIELSPTYVKLIEKRLAQGSLDWTGDGTDDGPPTVDAGGDGGV